MILREPPAGVEVLTELVGQKQPEEEGSLWRNLRLDWVRNWDKSCQTAITLSRRQHSGASTSSIGGSTTKDSTRQHLKSSPLTSSRFGCTDGLLPL